jgi:hypothetical protein
LAAHLSQQKRWSVVPATISTAESSSSSPESGQVVMAAPSASA